MKKRLLALVLGICLAVSLLTGCTSSTSSTHECAGSWAPYDGNNAEDSIITTSSIDLLSSINLNLEDVFVLTINTDGTFQQYFCGFLMEGQWKKVNNRSVSLVYTIGDKEVTATVSYRNSQLSYTTETGEVLYFRSTNRNAKKMYEQFSNNYKGTSSEEAFLNQITDQATAIEALTMVQQIQAGEEAITSELLNELGVAYYSLPATEQERISNFITQYKSLVTGVE